MSTDDVTNRLVSQHPSWGTAPHPANPLEGLRSPDPLLKSHFLGNHEYKTGDVINWFNYLQTLNITPLHNSHSVIDGDEGGKICLAGIDDPQAEKSW